MLFDTLVHDFGTIIEGEMVVCYFDYENNGEGRSGYYFGGGHLWLYYSRLEQ